MASIFGWKFPGKQQDAQVLLVGLFFPWVNLTFRHPWPQVDALEFGSPQREAVVVRCAERIRPWYTLVLDGFEQPTCVHDPLSTNLFAIPTASRESRF